MEYKKNSKVIIFAQSYGEIENCLYLAKENHKCKNSVTIVIPSNNDLFKLMRKINKEVFHNTIDIIYFDLFKSDPIREKNITIIRVLKTFINAVKEKIHNKKAYDKYLGNLKGGEIFFFTRFCVPYNLYFLKKLSKNNKLIYMYISRKRTFHELDNGYGEGLSKVAIDNVQDFLRLVRLKLVYGLEIIFIRIIINTVEYIPDSFMSKYVYKIISMDESRTLLKDFNYNEFNVFNVADYRIIYFDQRYFYRDNLVDTQIFQNEINNVFIILGKYFKKNEIGLKYHPGDDSEKNKIKYGVVLENFIPAEFLYNDNVKIYLSFSSGSLGNVEKGLAVSLIDLITYKTEGIRQKVKEATLKKSYSNILFPKSLDDLEKIIISVSE